MNNIYKYSALLMSVALASCSPDDVSHPSEAGKPLAADIDAKVIVDQTTNEVTFSLNNKACMPLWIINDGSSNTISTVNGYTKIFPTAGTYSAEVKISNANGTSDGSVVLEFTLDNTIINWDPYYKRLSSGYSSDAAASKEWQWASQTKGHLGCGNTGTEGLEWYSAEADAKAAFGLYDDSFIFSNNNEYTFNPGEGGTVYVNVGCSAFSEFNTTGEDFMATVQTQNSSWELSAEGNDVYLTFPAQTLLGYVPNDEIYNNPKFKVLTLKENLIELVADNGTIAWHYILEPKTAELTKADMIAGSTSKTWVWDSNNQGHLGCGESGTDGLGWWSANPNDKQAFGVYDDEFVFAKDGSYTYNPGEGGTVFVNVGCTIFPEFNTTGEDFMATVEPQSSSWSIVEEGSDTYLVFPAQTLVGYVPNDDAYSNPKFKITELTENSMDLVIDNGTIAWHYRFVTKGNEGDEPEVFDEGEELMTSEYENGLLGSWTWEASTPGHFGCGESVNNPTGWWSAPAFDKEGLGLYDDILTFEAGNVYKFAPGEGGTVFVNTGCSLFAEFNTNDGVDFAATVEAFSSTYSIEIDGGEYYLQFPANTIVSYIPSDAFYANPRFKISRMCDNLLELITIQEGIAWKYRMKRTN